MAVRYCLDTHTAIYFLAGRLAEPLPEGEWLISVITELELRSYSFATSGDELKVAEFFDCLEAGDSLDVFLEEFPSVCREQAVSALELALEVIAPDAHPA